MSATLLSSLAHRYNSTHPVVRLLKIWGLSLKFFR